jgi:RNA polymerase sigma factor (sigma-70 family)
MPPDAIEDDADLLRTYCAEASESAFRALVERHLPSVWSAARRIVNGDAALAEDIAQEVFAHLAQRAGKLPPQVVLGGWLHRHTCFTASKTVRAAARRRAREFTAAAMQTPTDDLWPDISPHLDAALESLTASDRDAVVLRFFEQRDFRSIGKSLGTSEDAARMKTNRAIEKLRGILGKRSALLTVAGLTALLGDHAIAAPPSGMAAQIAFSSLTNAGRAAATTGFAALLARLLKMNAALVGGAVLLVAGGSIWYWQTQLGDTGTKSQTNLSAPRKSAARPATREPGVVDVAFHFLMIPDDKAAAILNQRWNGDGDTDLLTDLLKQAGAGTGGVILAQRLTGSCRSGSRTKLGRTNPISYGTEWDLEEDGTLKTSSSAEKGIGTTAEMELTINDDGSTCDLNLQLRHHFAEPELQRWPASLTNPDAPGLPALRQPEFRSTGTNAQVFMGMGHARLVSASQLPPPNGPASGARGGYLFTFVSLPPLTTGPSIVGHPGYTVSEVSLRVVTFEKAGAATALEAARPGDDEKLFASLATSVAEGSAKITEDQTVNIRGGQRSKVEALREFPYPTEARIHLSKGLCVPTSFGFRNTGQTTEAEVTVGEGGSRGLSGHLLDINLAPETVAMAFLNPWPVPDLRGNGQMGQVLQPVFTTYKCSNQILTATGLNMLVSVALAPQTVVSGDPHPVYRYRFLRTGLNGDKPAGQEKIRDYLTIQRRLHALTIRLPRDEAALLLVQREGSDAALFDELSMRVTAGTASLGSHTSILCRNGQRSKVESIAEFPFPTQYQDLIPDHWTFQAQGSWMEVESRARFTETQTPYSGEWNGSLDLVTEPDMVEYQPDANRPHLHSATFENVSRKFAGGLSIPSSGVLCAGAFSTSPATSDENLPDGMTDILFMIQSPPPERQEAEAKPQALLHALMLSVPASDGHSLTGFTGKPEASVSAATRLLQRLETGEIHCAAQAALVVRQGQRSLVACGRQVQHPSDFVSAESSPDVRLPASWESAICGIRIEAEWTKATDAVTLRGAVSWDSAPVLPFSVPGSGIPEMKDRRCEERIELKDLVISTDKPIIADVRPSRAREGTSEHGRWHVLILKATR